MTNQPKIPTDTSYIGGVNFDPDIKPEAHKTFKCWIEFKETGKDTPTVHFMKPLKREMKFAREYDYHFYEAEIILKKECK